jgi:2-dehydropantoate 2-reductase
MKILVLGAGSLGSVMGGFLYEAGYEVTLLGKKAHMDAINERGLRIDGVRGEHVVHVRASSNPVEVEEADLLILTIKHKDTQVALGSISHLHEKIKTALSFQNGILKDEPLKRIFGEKKVLCGITTIGATLSSPGVVNLTGAGITYIGEYGNGESERVANIVDMFNRAGIETRSHTDAEFLLWAKVMRYIPTSVIAALTRLPQPKYMTKKATAELNIILTREIAAVAHEKGIAVKDIYKLPLLALTEGDFEVAVERVMGSAQRMMDDAGAGSRPSMLQDIERGRKTEIEETAGYIISEAKRLGVEVSHLDTCYRLIRTMDEFLM